MVNLQNRVPAKHLHCGSGIESMHVSKRRWHFQSSSTICRLLVSSLYAIWCSSPFLLLFWLDVHSALSSCRKNFWHSAGHWYTKLICELRCNPIQQLSPFTKITMFWSTPSERVTFTLVFIEVELDDVISRGVSNVFAWLLFKHDRGVILETHFNIMQSSTTPPLSMTSIYTGEVTPLWRCQQKL